jgi:hypothetical protein
MKKIAILFSAFSLFLFLFISCNKEKILKEKLEMEAASTSRSYHNSDADYYVLNGRIKFKDLEAFENVIKEITNKDEAYLTQWEAKLVGFTSMRTAYNLFSNLNENQIPKKFKEWEMIYLKPDKNDPGSCECESPVTDLYFASLLSYDGVMQIADSIYQIDYEKVRIITDGDEKKLPELRNYNENRPDKKIVVRDVEHWSNTCTESFSSTRRLKGKMTIDNYAVYGVAYLKTKYQEKKNGCWKKQQAQTLRIQASWETICIANWCPTFLQNKSYDSGNQNGKDMINHIITNSVGAGAIYHFGTSKSTHTAKKDNVTKICNDMF